MSFIIFPLTLCQQDMTSPSWLSQYFYVSSKENDIGRQLSLSQNPPVRIQQRRPKRNDRATPLCLPSWPNCALCFAQVGRTEPSSLSFWVLITSFESCLITRPDLSSSIPLRAGERPDNLRTPIPPSSLYLVHPYSPFRSVCNKAPRRNK